MVCSAVAAAAVASLLFPSSESVGSISVSKISWPGTSRQVDEAPFVSEEKQNGCGSPDKSQPLKVVIESKTVRKVNCVY